MTIGLDLQNLLQWATSHGCQISDSIEFRASHQGVSVYSKETFSLSKYEVIVPDSIIITPDKAFEQLDIDPKIDPVLALKLYLCYLKSTGHEDFAAYVKCLPPLRKIGSPITFSEQELDLLKGTNIFNSVPAMRAQLLAEYEELLTSQGWIIAKNYDKLCKDDFFSLITGELSEGCHYPPQFSWFLWAHLILTSRAFPYRLINPKAPSNAVMLLPIVDLFNHKAGSKVTWLPSQSQFGIRIEETVGQGEELFNNYGPKGNEELFIGYGFTIPDNEHEQLQLSINIQDVSERDLGIWDIKLPKMSDYTFSVSSDGQEEHGKEVMTTAVFICNNYHTLPEGLLELFAYKSRNQEDTQKTLASLFKGLNNLKAAIDHKFKNITDKPSFGFYTNSHLIPGATNGNDQLLSGNCENSIIYKRSQLKLGKLIKASLKDEEKRLLKTYRAKLITVKDMIKKDLFISEAITKFNFASPEENLSVIEQEILVSYWLLMVAKGVSSNLNSDWVQKEFLNCADTIHSESSDAVRMYEMLSQDSNIPDWQEMVSLEEFVKADQVKMRNYYAKGAKGEPILIVPTTL
ncbi:hypothetical protein OGAPHI_004647 [Ogataea philodendri]|uniref:SET domain-containing protein n=1 Tax=Ogataea philodendri TaxID=1378263 RepID=A0A9P8T3S2_9ASCO|nr:uncharacterized protein OGAPHI_004647 [Ogataea philodendri]KAH3664295.1 hypothetical protein OGAPHI_004647 [Ogataea philodendri]